MKRILANTVFLIPLLLIICVTTLQAGGPAATVRYRDHYDLDSLGNARITRTMQFPAATYAEVKRKTDDPLMLLRSFASQIDWHEIEIVDSRFDDSRCQVQLELFQRGLAKTIGDSQWQIASRAKPGAMELITCADQRVIFHAAQPSEWGPMSATVSLNMCDQASNVEFDEKTATIRFRANPLSPPEEATATAWKMEVTPRIMSSLAKVYSNEDFNLFWTGRSVFTNLQDQPVRKFQVRFQLQGYSSWSPWKRTPIVYPGQTVVESFFPVLDIDALSKLDGSRAATVIAEYRYEDFEGNLIEETDSERLDLMARNEVVFSRHRDAEALNWEESNEYLPMILASFCTSNDPVIQQLAGRISGMADGPAASLASEDAINYIRATWQFLEDNKISYQTSPGLNMDQHFGQHIKYGRDLLRNRAGTCVDLAIFWASSAKAVGLKSFIVVMPGHAFPMIELPNGVRVPLEATLIGRGATVDDASTKGDEVLEKAMAGPHFIVDVDQMHDYGVRSLDLERVSEDFFDKLNYRFESLRSAKEE